ncbi:hypothetical protein NQ318_001917 [Aromia moschata]|uniref:Uncharacterized protein n=1 Tax=Aromia moschata TaxID=1265417 RepID=A0AAV8Z1X2_9CUCU|nr:hypothetical protein NQ318_001917 [Aromia moschata]
MFTSAQGVAYRPILAIWRRRFAGQGVAKTTWNAQAEEFGPDLRNDTTLRFEQFRQKKVPPTKAYVTLLSLYDLLNKESKNWA